MVYFRPMKRIPLLIAALILFCAPAYSQYVKILGSAEQGGNTVSTSGVTSTTKVQKSFPGATVTVYSPTGSGTIASIFSASTGTVHANPFSASSTDGTIDFFILPGSTFDIRISGVSGGVTITPFTRSGYTAPGNGISLAICGGTADTTLLSTLNALGGTIEIPTGVTCASNSQTLSAALRIDNSGLLKPLNGQTVTLTGAQNDDVWQKYTTTTTGVVSFLGNRHLHQIYPEWWGAIADGTTSCSTGVQAAFDASKTLILPTTLNAGVPIIFGVGKYLFNTAVSYLAVQNTSIEIRGQGYSTEFIPGADITILTLNQGASSNQGMRVSGIYFYLADRDAAAMDLTLGGQLGKFQDIWINSPSINGTKKIISICGEFIVLNNIQIEGTGTSRALTNTNTGIYLNNQVSHGAYRVWMSNIMFLKLSKGVSVDTAVPNGATFSFTQSSASGCVTAIDLGGAVTGTAQSNWTISDNQFEGNTTIINLLGVSGGTGGAPLREVTVERNYFTGMITGDTGIVAKNVTGFNVLRNYWKNDDGSDHGAVALSVMSGVSNAKKEGNITTSATRVNMTIAGNSTGSPTSTPLFTNADLSSDGASIDQTVDPIVGSVQSLSGAGAINVTALTTAFTSTGGAQALTLTNGAAGQIKTILHVVDGGSGVLTPTTKTGFSTITFTNAGDAVTLQYFTTVGWIVIGWNGVTITP